MNCLLLLQNLNEKPPRVHSAKQRYHSFRATSLLGSALATASSFSDAAIAITFVAATPSSSDAAIATAIVVATPSSSDAAIATAIVAASSGVASPITIPSVSSGVSARNNT